MRPRRPAARPRRPSSDTTRAAPRVSLAHGALQLPSGPDGAPREVPLLAGAVHYFRIERASWRRALTELVALGATMVETYVPWQVHERAPGDLDFGAHDPQKDLGAFLDLAHELGLLALVRPGPHINSEMTFFGLPERIVYDRACQARSPKQSPVILGFPPRMFPVPSYASETFVGETTRWYEAFAEVVRPRLYPAGPVVMVQVDNEAAFYFRDSQYDQDYHPDAVSRFARYVVERHGSLEDAALVHRREYTSLDDVRAPERFDAKEWKDLAIHLDWARFREELITTAIARFERRLAAAGIEGIPTIHNLPLGEQAAPVSLPALERVVDVVGFDYYHARREHRTIKRRTLALVGTSRLPFSPEMGVGAPPWFTPLAHEDSLYCAMVACAYGLRGMSLYMAVDRDRWYGAPIDDRGNPRVEAASWKQLFAALTATRFHRLRRRASVGLVMPREYARLARAMHLLGVISPVTLEAVGGTPVDGASEDPLGFAGPIQILWWRMLARFADALTAAQIPYVYVDGDVGDERIAALRADGLTTLIVPSFELADPDRWARVLAFAEQGGTVVYGPTLPTLDDAMRPADQPEPARGRRVLIDTPEDASRVVAELGLAPTVRVSPAPLEATLHEDREDGAPRVLFVMYPAAVSPRGVTRSIDATVELDAEVALEDAMTGARYGRSRTHRLAIAPGTCRMLLVRHTD